MGFLYTLFFFLVALSILIAIHEYGHFWVARRFGIKILRFSIGFGPRILRRHDRTGTEYAISAIPLGGYVKMLDEREGPVHQRELNLAFNRRPVHQRFLVVLAGPLANFFFAIFAYWLMYLIGVTALAPVLGGIDADSVAGQAGLHKGLEIVAVNQQEVSTWQDVITGLVPNLGSEKALVIQAKDGQGVSKEYRLDTTGWVLTKENTDIPGSLGLQLFTPEVPAVIGELIPNEAAAAAGLKAGDRIVRIDEQEIFHWHEMVDIVRQHPGQNLDLLVERDDELSSVILSPGVRKNDQGEEYGFLGVIVETQAFPENLLREHKLSPVPALVAAVNQTIKYTKLSFVILGKMIVGDVSLNTISGPIGIARGAGQTASIGLEYFLSFLALISVSLAVLNILPIPVLDGGHLLYYLIEIVRGKPLSEKVQVAGFKLGMIFLLLLMSLAIYNDILRL